MPEAQHDPDGGPDYDVEVDADEVLADLAEMAASYGEKYEYAREQWRDSLDHVEPFHEARDWMSEHRGGQRALSNAIAALQPVSHAIPSECFRNDDGTVDVRGYMRWLSQEAEYASEDRREASGRGELAHGERHSAYTSVSSLLRDDYGVGWPRLDDLGGNPLECDLP